MKAPDKKYSLSVVSDLLASTPPNEVVFMPDKIYFDGVDTSTIPRLAINVEYIRKDALLEWIQEARAIPHENAIVRDLAFQEIVNKLSSM